MVTSNSSQQSQLLIDKIVEDTIPQNPCSYGDVNEENTTKTESVNQHNNSNNVQETKPQPLKRPLQSSENTENTVPSKRGKREKKTPLSVRFGHSSTHFPVIDKTRVVRCKNEGCLGKSYVRCPTCDVHLCFCIQDNRNCFTDYHMKGKM